MLVLTRKVGESFLIGDDIHITVEGIAGDKVKISIDAPKNITILRQELVDARKANEEALHAKPSDVEALKSSFMKRE